MYTCTSQVILVIFLHFLLSGVDLISNAALNEVMSLYVSIVSIYVVTTLVMMPFILTGLFVLHQIF